jgi:hypothetical protein
LVKLLLKVCAEAFLIKLFSKVLYSNEKVGSSLNEKESFFALNVGAVTLENFEKPLGYTTFYMFIHIVIYYENFNRLRAEGGVQASGTAWRSAGGD